MTHCAGLLGPDDNDLCARGRPVKTSKLLHKFRKLSQNVHGTARGSTVNYMNYSNPYSKSLIYPKRFLHDAFMPGTP